MDCEVPTLVTVGGDPNPWLNPEPILLFEVNGLGVSGGKNPPFVELG